MTNAKELSDSVTEGGWERTEEGEGVTGGLGLLSTREESTHTDNGTIILVGTIAIAKKIQT